MLAKAEHLPQVKSEPDPPMTVGGAAAANIRLIAWCRKCGRQVEPDPAELVRQCGSYTLVLDWREKLVCSHCGNRQVDMVVSGTERR
jgi:ribosomal protein L37E